MRESERDMENCRTNSADSEASSSHSKYGGTRPLNLGSRIFISHSGNDKNFVRHLHDKLVDLYPHDGTVFFDEKSLPTAEPISMENVLTEASECELGVLILTKDFFMHTPNPMLELETLTTIGKRLLPLFFRISVDEFKKMSRDNVWEERWKEWLKGDDRRLRAWKDALIFVDRFSGLEYSKLANNELEYIGKVVAEVVQIVHPARPFSEEGVWGMERLCEIVNNMYKQCASNRISYGYTQIASMSASAGLREDGCNSMDLVGIYGFGGLGKSTLCRCLCNYYYAEFHGKVCWLDLGSVPDSIHASSQTYSSRSAFMWRMLHLLSKLGVHIDGARSPEFLEIQNLLGNWIKKKPIFLAIDNILPDFRSPDYKSLEEVNFYLSCKFAKGSKIFITARNEKTLKRVIREYVRFSAVIEQIPKLEFEEAKDIFVHEIPKLSHISNVEDEIKECVNVCLIRPDDHLHHQRDVSDEWYHPLMLKSSAALIKYDRRHNVDLKIRLREFVQSTATIDKSDACKTIFDMFDISYAILSEEAQKVFLDLSLICRVINVRECRSTPSYAWIQTFYSHIDTEKLNSILWSLEDLSFIVIDYSSQSVRMHDLMVDFSKYKAMKGADAAGFTPRYLVLDSGAQLRNQEFSFLLAKAVARNEWPSISDLPKTSARAVSISGCSIDPGAREDVLDLRNVEGVEVLHLVYNPGVREVLLSRITLAHLRSFIVSEPRLDDGRRSSTLRCTIDEDWPTPPTASQMTMDRKLAWVEITGNVIISTCKRHGSTWWSGRDRSLLERLGISRSADAHMCGLGILQTMFCNLQYLALSDFRSAKSIDLTTCTNLKRLRLSDVLGLRNIHGLETITSLCELRVGKCHELLLLSIPANLKVITSVWDCRSLERISLPTLSHQEAARGACALHEGNLYVLDCPALRTVDGMVQYTGKCRFERSENMQEVIQELVKPFETGSSKFKGKVGYFCLRGYPVQGLAGLIDVVVKDAQHVGLLISALVKAQARGLSEFLLYCKEDGDCGCDKNEPYFGPGVSPSTSFKYCCTQVRNLASLGLLVGNGLRHLSLRGCKNVGVWPDFATMTSLEELDLSYTSLKEWPTGARLHRLKKLDIQGCWQLPAEEMIKALSCFKPLGRNSAWGRGPLESLWADFRCHRRDRGSVVDALDLRWPELVALLHEQWQYLRYPYPYPIGRHPCLDLDDRDITSDLCPGLELCSLIRLMYYLWFGVECYDEDGSACACADSVPAIREKMKRLLCSEIFMCLPFYVWRIGRARLHAVDEWQEYPWPEGYESYMAFALIGSASIGCFNASLNDDLKDRMVNFIQSFAEAQPQHAAEDFDATVPVFEMRGMCKLTFAIRSSNLLTPCPDLNLTKEAHERLAMRVGDAVCKMAKEPSVAAMLGRDFMHITMDGLKTSYSETEMSREACERLIRWHNRRGYWSYNGEYVEISVEACENFVEKQNKALRRKIEGRKPSVTALKSADGDGLGARVLHKIMLKIVPQSAIDFPRIWLSSSKTF